MGWKEDLKEIGIRTQGLQTHLGMLDRRQIMMNRKIDLVVKSIQDQMTRMGDRLIEMAMVNNGMGRDAAIHRRSLNEDPKESPSDLWEDNSETEWPPRGCDALNMP
ncbi:hypothetical protein LCGC14_0963460 [marine sediment metagenome]|uniref:Uncharacterized protein n=1 Tax=marine sediment metagenome TaxID=412755 RepID=A0A0F9NZW1_9ZZZZ